MPSANVLTYRQAGRSMNIHALLPHRVDNILGKLTRILFAFFTCAVWTGCTTVALDRAPESPFRPWAPTQDTSPDATPQTSQDASPDSATAPDSFAVAPDPRMAELAPGPTLDPERIYSLPELIDLAQREHPSTRLAWNRARQAALAVGIAEATFLPMLSANAIWGWQRTSTPSPLTLGGLLPEDIDTELRGVAPFLSLEWLLFDFGQRRALTDAAEHASYAANVLFNGTHQRIIHDVAHAYYTHGAALAKLQTAEQALANSERTLEAVQARVKAGIATTVELALARQHVAQSKLRKVNAQTLTHATYQGLLAAAGLPASAEIRIGGLEQRTLPRATASLTADAIQTALSRRPDLQASYAALAAAKAGVTAAEAAFLPKVYLAAVAGGNKNRFNLESLPTLHHRSSTSAVLIGVTVPLYDAGLRAARLKDAEIRVEDAQSIFQRAQRDAVREIILAEDMLRSALASYHAASELVETTSIAHDAASEAYRNGLGTLTTALETATSLLDAKEARSDAYAASLSAAANLAFVMGAINTSRESWIEAPPLSLPTLR